MRNLHFIIIILFSLSTQILSQWISQNSGTQKDLHNLFFLNQNLGWVCGYDGTLLHTTNGGTTWISHSIGTLDDVHAIFFVDSLTGWAILYAFDPFRHGSVIHTIDGGNNWDVQLSIWDYTFHSIHFSDENNGWVAGSNGIVYHTVNGGTTWYQQYPPTGGGWLWPIFFLDNNIGWTAGDPLFGVFKSTNGGNSWFTYSVPVFERIYSLLYIDYNTGWLSGAYGQIAKSTNGGLNWFNVQSGTLEDLRDIFFIDNTRGWCVGHNGIILHTVNGGTNWLNQPSNISSILRAVQFVTDEIGWVVGHNGTILKTNNAGIPVESTFFSAINFESKVQLNWSTATEINNQGFEIERASEMEDWRTIGFVEGRGTTTEIQNYTFIDDLFGVTSDEIFYRLKQLDYDGSFKYSDVINVRNISTLEFGLEQNYPNPFNPLTTIKYSIPEGVTVSLKVYDSLGNETVTLVNSFQNAGNYKIEFNGSLLSSGVYFYKLNAGNFTQLKKLVILK